MKTKLFSIAIAFLSLHTANKAQAQENFQIKGVISPPTIAKKVYLNYTDATGQKIDSTKLINGVSFEFNGNLSNGSTPANIYLAKDGGSYGNQSYYVESRGLILYGGLTSIVGQNLKDATVKHHHKTKILIKTNNDTLDLSGADFTIGVRDKGNDVKYPRFFGGLTFSRLDWGFSRLINDGKFTLSDDNSVLEYKKASNFGFDVLQAGLRFSDNFKFYIAAGFEWNYLRLKKNILLTQDAPSFSYTVIDEADTKYKKNVLTSTYMRFPATFEWRSDKNRHGERVKVAFGAMTGILLKGTQRLKSNEYGKQKFKDNYNLSSFQYGPFVRIGYNDFGVFAKYYVNDMFENSPAQKGLNNFTFGLTLGF